MRVLGGDHGTEKWFTDIQHIEPVTGGKPSISRACSGGWSLQIRAMSHGRSLSQSKNAFLKPLLDNRKDRTVTAVKAKQRRQANVYDAVAGEYFWYSLSLTRSDNLGRISAGGFRAQTPYSSRYRDNASSSTIAVRPEEVLFRRQDAPVRYEENDFYFANERLPPDCPLPPSDLLQAIHAYSADFYENAITDGGADNFRSMDETALIAMGILLEEMAKESLGETGDLVLVEGEEIEGSDGEASVSSLGKSGRKRSNASVHAGSAEELRSVRKMRKRKRRTPRPESSAPETEVEAEA